MSALLVPCKPGADIRRGDGIYLDRAGYAVQTDDPDRAWAQVVSEAKEDAAHPEQWYVKAVIL